LGTGIPVRIDQMIKGRNPIVEISDGHDHYIHSIEKRLVRTDYCAYPPQIVVEITKQRDRDRPAFILSSASVDRYLLSRL
jgi:hypothetical protein